MLFRSGTFSEPYTDEDMVEIKAKVPMIEIEEYVLSFVSITKGKGTIETRFCGYDICHNEKDVIEAFAYNAEADKENPPHSVFCAKGAGYTVHYTRAKESMHLEIIK